MSLHVDTLYVQGNILITQDGKACIADFGIVGMFRDLTYHDYKLETLRYIAPERLSEDLFLPTRINGPSKASDVYSLAMTSFEVRSCRKPSCYPIQIRSHNHDQVLTGILPYEDSNKGSVIADIRLGKRPPRPTDPSRNRWLQDHVWDMIETCWSNEPGQRSELFALHHVFSTIGPQITQIARSDRPGDLTI